MQRGCTAILRHGILKQYPPVLIRLGASNITANTNINSNDPKKRELYHNQYYGVKERNNVNLSGLNVQNEEELHKACIHMIEQCQLMVRKLQLQSDRPNSKSARRRHNPRNSNFSPAIQQNTIRKVFNSISAKSDVTPECFAICDRKKGEIEITRVGKQAPMVAVEEDKTKPTTVAAQSFGPKLLQSCRPPLQSQVAATEAADVQAAAPAATNRRGTTRKRVHSAARTCQATQLAPQQKGATMPPSSTSFRHPVDTDENAEYITVHTYPRRSPARTNSTLCNTDDTNNSNGKSTVAAKLSEPDPRAVRIVENNIVECSDDSAVTTAADTRTRIGPRIGTTPSFLPLLLKDTPLQSRLRAEERARAKLPPPPPPNAQSQADRCLNAIYPAMSSCLESLGRLPRILQTPHLIQQCCQQPLRQRCAKNSMPDLPKSVCECTQPTIITETFLTPSAASAAHRRIPPKLLADCTENKQLYSRTNIIGQRELSQKASRLIDVIGPSMAATASINSSSGAGGGGGGGSGATRMCCYNTVSSRHKRSQQQVRQLKTSSCGCQPAAKSNDPDALDTCTGRAKKDLLRPQSRPQERRPPVCRPTAQPATEFKGVTTGFCKDGLLEQLTTTATAAAAAAAAETQPQPQQQQRVADTLGGQGQGEIKNKEKKKKKNLPRIDENRHRPPGRCAAHHPTSSSTAAHGLCTPPMNECIAVPPSVHRLRRPPIPKHLLRRQPACFRPCMPSPGVRQHTNCEKMLFGRAKAKEAAERSPDPMKQPVSPCVVVRRCKQADGKVLHMFPPPPRTDADLPPSVLPYPKDLCGQSDPNAVPPWNVMAREEAGGVSYSQGATKEVNTSGPVPAKRPPPHCAYGSDESFVCQSEEDRLHPTYPSPICPPLPKKYATPQRIKDIDVLKHVPCAKRSATSEERLKVDEYCDPCYRAKELHRYSDTAYYDMHNYMAWRRRRPPGPPNHKRKKPLREDPDPCKS